MALGRNWYTDANYTFPDYGSTIANARAAIWGLKALLMQQITGVTTGSLGTAPVSAAWTCTDSSDGAAVGTSDLWGSSYDSTKLVFNNAGSNHSWIVLKSPNAIAPDGPYYLLIDLNSNSALGYLSISYAKTAFTGGTVTTAPTSTDTVAVTTTTYFYYDTNIVATHRLNITRDANGGFYFVPVRQGRGNVGMVFGLVYLDDMAAGDGWKLMSLYGSTSTVTNDVLVSPLTLRGRTYSAAATFASAPFWLNFTGTTLVTTEGINSRTLGFLVSPALCYVTLSNFGYRGKVPDFYYLGTGRALGDVYPTSGTQELVCFLTAFMPFTCKLVV